jgi:excisionase family DNA binding protein
MIRFLLLVAALLPLVVQRATCRMPSLAELRDGPAAVDIPTAARALGISRSYGFELARRGEFPCRTIRVGSRIRVPRAALLALLEATAVGESR